MTAAILEVRDLVLRGEDAPPHDADIGIDRRIGFDVGAGEIVALLGANGAGKTSLARAVIGEIDPAEGRIALTGRDLQGLAPHRRALLGIGYCPAGRRVFPGMSVRDNLLVAASVPAADRRRMLADAMALFPALKQFADTPAWQLSGGQQQMLAIGRALMTGPRLLLLDEPSLGLAPILVEELLAKLKDVATSGMGVLLAEQNIGAALRIADRAVVLAEGAMVARGPAAEIAGRDDLAALAMGV